MCSSGSGEGGGGIQEVTEPFEPLVRAASRALVLGIGGGGDVIGSLAVARRCEALGTPFVLGGVAWERFARDPRPGPRPADEIAGGRRIGEYAVIAGPETATVDGTLFSEAFAAAHLRAHGDPDAETVLIDVTGGSAGVAEGIAAAAAECGCDLVVLVDIGGDAIAAGGERGLASPLCDAVMLGGAARLEGLGVAAAVLGPGCDGELEIGEVLARIAVLARAGAWTGTFGVDAAVADEVAEAAAGSGTEASIQVVRCARGELGEVRIRSGLRSVELSPVGALAFCFDPVAALAELPLVRAVADAEGLEQARAALEAIGVRTELDYERERAARA